MPRGFQTLLLDLVLSVAGLATVAGFAAGPQPDRINIAGDWVLTVTSANGTGPREVTFQQEGDKVTGFIKGSTASGPLTGEIKGKQLKFVVTLEFGGEEFLVTYKGAVEGSTMEGSVDMGTYGTGTFTGVRSGSKPSASPQASRPPAAARPSRERSVERRHTSPVGVVVNKVLTPELVVIPGGAFQMGGQDRDTLADERPEHTVEVAAFRISRFEVTNAQYLAFTQATGYDEPPAPKGWGQYVRDEPNHPVVNISWDDAVAYCHWLTKVTGQVFRLPTEAEWEYAARAGADGDAYVWGAAWDDEAANTASYQAGSTLDRLSGMAWWDADGRRASESRPMTTEVGTFKANRWGLHDMAGNVWEWCADWYASDYYGLSPRKNPLGPSSGVERVLRGGSWRNLPQSVRVAIRNRYTPVRRLNYNGLRVVSPATGDGRD